MSVVLRDARQTQGYFWLDDAHRLDTLSKTYLVNLKHRKILHRVL